MRKETLAFRIIAALKNIRIIEEDEIGVITRKVLASTSEEHKGWLRFLSLTKEARRVIEDGRKGDKLAEKTASLKGLRPTHIKEQMKKEANVLRYKDKDGKVVNVKESGILHVTRDSIDFFREGAKDELTKSLKEMFDDSGESSGTSQK